jgi:MFS family permease
MGDEVLAAYADRVSGSARAQDVAESPRPGGTSRRRWIVLRQPFSTAFIAQTFIELADQMLQVTLAWAVLVTSGGSALGLVLMAWAGPRGVLLLVGGALVDRGDRRRTGAAASAGLAALVAFLAVVSFAGMASLPLWLAAAPLLGFLDAVRLPIGYAVIPLLVKRSQIVEANRWSQLRLWTVMSVGPALGGVAIAALGVGGGLAAVAILYAFGGALLLALPPLVVAREERPSVIGDLVAGFAFVRRHERLRLLLPVFAAVNLCVLGLHVVGIPLFVKEGLDGSAGELGLVVGGFGAGLMLGTLALGRLPRWLRGTTAGLFALFALSDLWLALVGLAPTVAGAAGALFVSGFFLGPASTLYQGMLQTTTPPAYLGRVAGMSRAISFGFEPISASMVGQLSRFVASGLLLLAGGLVAMVIDVLAMLKGRAFDRTDAGLEAASEQRIGHAQSGSGRPG